MPTDPFSFVLEFPPASPEDARRHFLSRLAVETDVSDVALDLERKRGGFVVVDAGASAPMASVTSPGRPSLPWRTIDEKSAAQLRGKLVVLYCWGPACNAADKAGARLGALGIQVKESNRRNGVLAARGTRHRGHNPPYRPPPARVKGSTSARREPARIGT